MAYSQTFNMVQGDTPQVTLTLRDNSTPAPGKTLDPEDSRTWAVINLTGAAVVLRLRVQGEDDVKQVLNGVVTDPLNGKVTFVFDGSTLDTPGTLEGETEFTDSEGVVQTVFDLIRINVRAHF